MMGTVALRNRRVTLLLPLLPRLLLNLKEYNNIDKLLVSFFGRKFDVTTCAEASKVVFRM